MERVELLSNQVEHSKQYGQTRRTTESLWIIWVTDGTTSLL